MNINEPKIQVIVRKRPLTQKESAKGEFDIVAIEQGTKVVIREPKLKLDLTKFIDEHTFKFDAALNENVSNWDLYLYFVRPVLKHVFDSNKATVFAFGQTGSGKTYTMNGNSNKNVSGVYDYASHDIFTAIQQPQFKNFKIKCTFYELYCNKVYDLLNQKKQLRICEDKKKDIKIVGGTEPEVKSAEELLKCIRIGMNARTTSANGTNSESSRSHAILQISIFSATETLFGQISFIDLAGCQRGADTIDQNKQTKVDGAQINKSLLALKECIRAMDNQKKHIPFRGSKLTMILRDSFTDNCKTLMIGNISPGKNSCENTLNTLRYSDTVRQLKNPKDQASKQDMKAKQLMLSRQSKNTVHVISDQNSMEQEGPSFHRYSLRQPPTFKQMQNQQGNQNCRNQNILRENSKKKISFSKLKQAQSKPVSGKGLSPTEPLNYIELQDWQNSVQLIREWDILNESLQPYEQLVLQIRGYLNRELQQYLSLCQSTVQMESKLNNQLIQALEHIHTNPHETNKEMYEKSTFVSSINQKKAELISQQQGKLASYMSHLEQQEECERKLRQAQEAQYMNNQSNDDQMSMIDEIQSQWNQQLFSYEQPQVHRPITRQSLNIQKGYNNLNVMRSFEFRS